MSAWRRPTATSGRRSLSGSQGSPVAIPKGARSHLVGITPSYRKMPVALVILVAMVVLIVFDIAPLVAAVLMPLSSATVMWGASRVESRVRRAETRR